MSGQVNYLVQVNCQPSPVGYEDRIIDILSQSFNVQRCDSTRAGVNLEMVSNHPLAYGAFKDLSDAVERAFVARLCQIIFAFSGGCHTRVMVKGYPHVQVGFQRRASFKARFH